MPTVYTVTSTADVLDLTDVPVTLRDAVELANTDPTLGQHRINFAANLGGETILLKESLELKKDIYIEGQANKITLQRDAAQGDFRLLMVNQNKVCAVSNLIFRGGRVTIDTVGGGAIYSRGNLTVTSSEFHHNIVSGGLWGGAINAPTGTLDITGSVFLDNSAYNGGAIAIGSGVTAVTISSSTISLNGAAHNGGGVYISPYGNRTATFNGVVMAGNVAVDDGAGIWSGGTTLVLTGGTHIHNNVAQNGSGGGVFINGGSVNYSGVTIGFNTSAVIGDGVSRHNATRIDGPGGLTLQGGDIEWVG